MVDMEEAKRRALLETGKTFGRGLWFGFIGLVVTLLGQLVTSGQLNDINVTVAGVPVNLSLVVLFVVSSVVKLLDRYQHSDASTATNGLAPRFLQR